LTPTRLVEDFFVRVHDFVARGFVVHDFVTRGFDVRGFVTRGFDVRDFVARVPVFFVWYIRVLVFRVLAIDHNLPLRVKRFLRHGTMRRRNNQLIAMIGRRAENL
jgi:hypothetical protein